MPTLGPIRRLKALADQRLGTLSRLLQFCMVGASGMIIDLSAYAWLQWVFRGTALAETPTPLVHHVPLAVAIAGVLSVWVALTWNFALNRRVTFNDARRGDILNQYLTYALANSLAIVVSLAFRLGLPAFIPFFRNHLHSAAVIGIVAATGISFTVARWLVFRPKRPTLLELDSVRTLA